MSAKLLIGKPVADCVCQDIISKIGDNCNKKLYTIGFDEPRWQQYASSLTNSAKKYGFVTNNIVVKNDTSVDEFCNVITSSCNAPDCGGVILQQPLPKEYLRAVDRIDENMDVDCLTDGNIAKLYKNECNFAPATPLAVIKLLEYYQIDLTGKNVVIVGRGSAVGKPLALLMLSKNATVTVCHTKTQNLSVICKNADILVSACGVPGLITKDFVTDKSIVIDVGLSFVDGVTRGDVASDVADVCLAMSPVPGGVGPITRAMLFSNLVKAIKK